MKHKSDKKKKSTKSKSGNKRMPAAMMKNKGSAARVVTMSKGGNLQVQAKNASDSMVKRLNKRRKERFERYSGTMRNRKDSR